MNEAELMTIRQQNFNLARYIENQKMAIEDLEGDLETVRTALSASEQRAADAEKIAAMWEQKYNKSADWESALFEQAIVSKQERDKMEQRAADAELPLQIMRKEMQNQIKAREDAERERDELREKVILLQDCTNCEFATYGFKDEPCASCKTNEKSTRGKDCQYRNWTHWDRKIDKTVKNDGGIGTDGNNRVVD